MQTTLKTVEIGNNALRAVSAKVNDLNKRAAKHGLEPMKLEVVKTVALVELYRIDTEYSRRYGCIAYAFGQSEDLHTVAISGVEPCIGGWKFVAKIEFNQDLGNIVKTVGDAEVDPRYRTVGPICEHCNSVRRRNDTFVLRHEVEGDKIVGRNCLADFLRDGDAESLANFAEMFDRISGSEMHGEPDDGEYRMRGYEGGPLVTTLAYLAMTSCVIRRFGWTSKTAARDNEGMTATTDWVGQCYWGDNRRKFIAKYELYPTDKDLARAADALAWAVTQADDRSEYLNNIGKLAGAEFLTWKYDGFVASIIAAHGRAMDQEVERKKAQAERVFIGEPGKRMKGVTGTVTRLRFTEGYYGSKTIVTIEVPVDGKRAVLTWFASGDKDGDFTEGEEITFDASVKKHESDPRYGDSTIVTRLTVKGVVGA